MNHHDIPIYYCQPTGLIGNFTPGRWKELKIKIVTL